MTEPLTLVGAFLLGLAGSPHCIGMCGAISCLGRHANSNKKVSPLFFQLGRVGSYTLLGVLLGGFGAMLSSQWLPIGLAFRILASALLVMMAVSLAGWFPATRRLEQVGAGLWRKLQPLSRHLLPADTPTKALFLGGLWGLLPCGLIYSALAWATLSANPYQSGMLMAAFGLGTLPALLSVSLAQGRMVRVAKRPATRQLVAALMIVLAIFPLAQMAPALTFLHGAHHQHLSPDSSLSNAETADKHSSDSAARHPHF